MKRTKTAEPPPNTVYVVVARGDNDFGASKAETYGVTKALEEWLAGRRREDERDNEEDFYVTVNAYQFYDVRDVTLAVMMCNTVGSCIDNSEHADYHVITADMVDWARVEKLEGQYAKARMVGKMAKK